MSNEMLILQNQCAIMQALTGISNHGGEYTRERLNKQLVATRERISELKGKDKDNG